MGGRSVGAQVYDDEALAVEYWEEGAAEAQEACRAFPEGGEGAGVLRIGHQDERGGGASERVGLTVSDVTDARCLDADSCGARGDAECRGVVGGGCETVAEVVVEDLRGVVFIMVDDHDWAWAASVPLPLECGYDNALGCGECAAEKALELATVDVGRADCALAVGCDEASEHFFYCKVRGSLEG